MLDAFESVKSPKKAARCGQCGLRSRSRYDQRTYRVRDLSVAGWRIYLKFERWRVDCRRCGGVYVESLDWRRTRASRSGTRCTSVRSAER
jgi:transposase